MNVIKTFNLKYEVMVGNGSITYIDVDDRFVTQNIFVASDADSNYVFISLRGKFPILSISESGSVVESDSDTVSYGLFKAKIDDIFNNGTDYAVISQEEFGINEFTPTEDINTFIVNNYGYDVANDMILNVFNDRQLIGIVKGFMYDNIESIVFWNTEAMCLDILSPLDWNINIDDIDAQYNRNNTFRDYSVAIDTVNNKAYQTYLDDNNDIVKNEVTFTTIPNEMVRVGCKTYIADDFLKAVKDVTFKDTNERVASAAINLESTRSEYETVQGIYNTAVTAEAVFREHEIQFLSGLFPSYVLVMEYNNADLLQSLAAMAEPSDIFSMPSFRKSLSAFSTDIQAETVTGVFTALTTSLVMSSKSGMFLSIPAPAPFPGARPAVPDSPPRTGRPPGVSALPHNQAPENPAASPAY